MSCQTPCPPDHPLMIAWSEYRVSEGYASTKSWASHVDHTEGSLWAAFSAGWERGHLPPPEGDRARRRRLLAKVGPLGRALRAVGAVRFHEDGSALGQVHAWWHPATWVLLAVALPVAAFSSSGVAELVPLRLSRHWRGKRDEVRWV